MINKRVAVKVMLMILGVLSLVTGLTGFGTDEVYALDEFREEYPVYRYPENGQVFRGEDEFLNLHFFDEYWREVEQEAGEFFPGLSWRDAFSWVQPGGSMPGIQDFLNGIYRYFMAELLLNIRFMGNLLILAVLAAFLQNLQESFDNSSISWLTKGVVVMALMVFIIPGFTAAINMAGGIVDTMADFSLSLLPVLTLLLASLGGFSSEVIFRPAIIFSINYFSMIIKNIIFPMIYFYTVVALAHNIIPQLRIGEVAKFFKDLCALLLGLSMTLFVALVSLKGMLGTVGDAVTLKTARYMSAAFIPVIGKILGDAVETVAGASLLLKNGITVAGLVVLGMMTVFPLLKLFALLIIYRLGAALISLLGESVVADCLTVMGNSIMLTVAVFAGSIVIFVMSVLVITASGNILVMLR